MKKKLILLIFILAVSGCNSKINSIASLTPTLSTNSIGYINIDNNISRPLLPLVAHKNNSYKLSKYNVTAHPVIFGEKIFSIDAKGIVSAFCLQTKEILWTSSILNKKQTCTLGGGILYNDGKLYITNGSRYVVILDAKNGHELLRKEFPDIIKVSPILIDHDKLLVQTISNQILVFDTLHSKITTIHESYVETVQSSYYMSPIIHKSKVIAAYNSGIIFAFDYKTGKEAWAINLNEFLNQNNTIITGYEALGISCAPLIDRDTLYIATTVGELLKINLNSGKVIWKSHVSDVQSISCEGNSIFVTTNANQVAALSLTDGKIKWAATIVTNDKKDKNVFYSEPFITSSADGMNFLTVLNNKGQSYNFLLKNNQLNCSPDIIPAPKNIFYICARCSNETFIIVNNKIVFLEKNKR